MSGGSFNYLCYSGTHDIQGRVEELQQMTDALNDLGYPDAARETYATIAIMRQQQIRLQTHIDRLHDVWKAVEWVESNDWAPDAIPRAIAEYRGETP